MINTVPRHRSRLYSILESTLLHRLQTLRRPSIFLRLNTYMNADTLPASGVRGFYLFEAGLGACAARLSHPHEHTQSLARADGFAHHTSHFNSEKGDGEGAGRGMARRLSRSDEDLRDRVVYACRTVRALGRTLTLSFCWRRGGGGCAHAG
ncbi:hypothetical protein B0H13DRAFT_620330 [Mycena leptocephala]|nr:hypothetical protein B0H13DRAFT_620330 [Mycena leptocephala]